MGQFYYLNPQNEQQGPVDASQLAAYGVNANTMVWTQGMAQWAPAGTVSELRPYIAPAPAAAPPPVYPPQPAVQSAPQPAAQPAPQPAAQPASQAMSYVASAGGGTPQPAMPKPSSNMVLAILSTLFCCLPLGLVGIVYASKVDGLYASGDYAGAAAASKSARNWSLIGAIGAIVISVLYLLIYGGAALAAMNGAFD